MLSESKHAWHTSENELLPVIKNIEIVLIFFLFMKKLLTILLLSLTIVAINAQSWSEKTYPDEIGYQQRIEGMLPKIAGKGFGIRSLAVSRCPDTGLPVLVWAIEGEEIISPYTGRKYKQGPTGYFGPKTRNENGEILAFGGDPLKYDLPPATATLLLNPNDSLAIAFLSIPGNLRQQYHFACKNWARFYPLLADKMTDKWRGDFLNHVASYAEGRRPSDGPSREWLTLTNKHNLVGQPGQLLGGNPLDGGTENHKTMWRTSGLLYSQILPDTARISGYPAKEAEKLTKDMIRDYLKRLLITGNGEYDSQIYYPHSIEGFLNLYDFSPDEETRILARFALDYYFVTYGLKIIDGTIAGAQKRGYLATTTPGEMETMLWAYFNNTSRDMSQEVLTIQQATTKYRPNQVIYNITNKNIPLPFEAKMSRPFYHMDYPHAFAESFYCSNSYAMGNIQMTIVDNPNQQMVWSVVTRGKEMPYCFSGGHPMRGSTSGHSPYTQTLQSKGTIILLTAPTVVPSIPDTSVAPTYSQVKRDNLWLLPKEEQGKNFELKNRMKYASKELLQIKSHADNSPAETERFWNESKGSASSWFYYPKQLSPVEKDGIFFLETVSMHIAVIPFGKRGFVWAPKIEGTSETAKFFKDYDVIVFPGEISGYVVETAEKSTFQTMEEFRQALLRKTNLDLSKLSQDKEINYFNLYGEKLRMIYNPTGLRCSAWINGKKKDWNNHTVGAVYDSPYLKIKNGIMKVSDGKNAYEIDFRKDKPVYKELSSPVLK